MRIASVFSRKIKLGLSGRKQCYNILENHLPKRKDVIWFHAASLGEFEQGRPLIRCIKRTNPQAFILQTFFSPSGIEIRRNDPDIDLATYIPFDTPKNVKRFLRTLDPKMAFFIKYDFWFNFIDELNKSKIPTYFVSAVFDKKQYFFKWYGKWFRTQLHKISHFFLQNQESATILAAYGISHYSISGDTRFDNVLSTLSESDSVSFPIIREFKKDSKLLVAGSTWGDDDDLLLGLLANNSLDWKVIIAPHEINIDRIQNFIEKCKRPCIKYSDWNLNIEYEILIIDNIGMLSQLYLYADMAYVGGGFGLGVHNILEAAVYSIPVVFGPKHQHFPEILTMIEEKASVIVNEKREFAPIILELTQNNEKRIQIGINASNFISERAGATQQIMQYLSR